MSPFSFSGFLATLEVNDLTRRHPGTLGVPPGVPGVPPVVLGADPAGVPAEEKPSLLRESVCMLLALSGFMGASSMCGLCSLSAYICIAYF